MKTLRRILFVVVALVVAYGGIAAIRAHSKLVTLNVRNADLRDVIRKVEWQTWEKIYVGKSVTGKITLNIHKVPLDQALDLIAEQASCRWATVYPLYSSSKSLVAFKESARGEINPAANGWTNYFARGFAGRMGGGFGNTLRQQNAPISLEIKGKDLPVAVMALARHASGRIIPEDGDYNDVWLTLDRATMPEAVAKLAKQVHRKWTSYYVLQGRRANPRLDDAVANADSGNPTNEPSADAVAAARQGYEALLDTMTPEERQQAEEARQRREAFQQMTPDERQQAMAQRTADPQFQQRAQERMLAGLLNSTPEERVTRTQLRLQRAGQRSR
jgi:hypothetical protein